MKRIGTPVLVLCALMACSSPPDEQSAEQPPQTEVVDPDLVGSRGEAVPADAGAGAGESVPITPTDVTPAAAAQGAVGTTTAGGESSITLDATPSTRPESTGSAADVDAAISPMTRRSSRGLDEDLAAYVSWPVVAEPEAVPQDLAAAMPHPPVFRTYVSMKNLGVPSRGTQLPAIEDDAVFLRESKTAADNFIRQIDVLRHVDGSWEFATWQRSSASVPFKLAADRSERCASCHNHDRPNLGVFATLTVVD